MVCGGAPAALSRALARAWCAIVLREVAPWLELQQASVTRWSEEESIDGRMTNSISSASSA